MTTTQWLALFIPVLTISVQFYVAIKRLKADHERQKKQSTIEDFGDTYLLCRYDCAAALRMCDGTSKSPSHPRSRGD
jgi:hypothetical protein